MEFTRRFIRIDRGRALGKNVPRIDSISQCDHAEPGLLFTIDDGPVDRGSASESWQQRGMKIHGELA